MLLKTYVNKASRVPIPKVCPPPCFPTSARGAERLDANILENNFGTVDQFERMEPRDNRAPFTGGIVEGAGGQPVFAIGPNKSSRMHAYMLNHLLKAAAAAASCQQLFGSKDSLEGSVIIKLDASSGSKSATTGAAG